MRTYTQDTPIGPGIRVLAVTVALVFAIFALITLHHAIYAV